MGNVENYPSEQKKIIFMRVPRLNMVENSVENVQNYFLQAGIIKFYFRLCKVELDFFVKCYLGPVNG